MTSDTFTPGPRADVSVTPDGNRWTLAFRRELSHPPDAVWRALTEAEQLARWAPFRGDRDLDAPGSFVAVMVDGLDERFPGEVRRVEPPSLLEYTWGDDLLRWELAPNDGGTRLILRHTVETRDLLPKVAAGWHLCLDVADRLLAGDPVDPIVGEAAMDHGWQELHDAYAEALGADGQEPVRPRPDDPGAAVASRPAPDRGVDMADVTEHEADDVATANASGKTPVVFVHGLWLLPSSWDRWRTVFEDAGYTTVSPGWPDDPETVAEAKEHPEVFAKKSVGDIADHLEAVVRTLDRKPAIVGHSFGGLLTQILAGRGCAEVSVAIDPAPFRGVLPLPISALRSASPVLHNPANRHRAVPLTYDQFRYAFANMVEEDEAKELYEAFSVPGSGEPIFQAAAANFNPWTEVKVRSKSLDRGPLLIVSGEHDHTVPTAIAKASFKKQRRNEAVTEFVEMPGRGHSLIIDNGWREVADTALAFVQRFASA